IGGIGGIGGIGNIGSIGGIGSIGKKEDPIWDYGNKGAALEQGFYMADCKWCNTNWTRGRPQDMKYHLASKYNGVPQNIKILWREYIAETPKQTSRSIKQSDITTHFQQIKPVSETRANELD
ncbi:19140_t:CDS:2, partial [Gigaspora rosea]